VDKVVDHSDANYQGLMGKNKDEGDKMLSKAKSIAVPAA
jgi:hypothetical protein